MDNPRYPNRQIRDAEAAVAKRVHLSDLHEVLTGDRLYEEVGRTYNETHRSYIGRRYRFEPTGITGTVCSEPFTLTIGRFNGKGLSDQVTHGCVAVSLDPEHRFEVVHAGGKGFFGTIIGHIDDVED